LRARITPNVRFGNQYKVPVDAPGRILACAYEIWPLDDRPSYTIEELESLRAISIDELARQIGLKRSATYDAVKAGRIPATKIGKRYCIPEDVVQWLSDRAYRHPEGLPEITLPSSGKGPHGATSEEGTSGKPSNEMQPLVAQ
jgi:excisionase family DNA binding protein